MSGAILGITAEVSQGLNLERKSQPSGEFIATAKHTSLPSQSQLYLQQFLKLIECFGGLGTPLLCLLIRWVAKLFMLEVNG